MVNNKNKAPEEYMENSVTISVPAEINIMTDSDAEADCLPPSCGNACEFSGHQMLCVSGQVVTTVRPHVKTRVKCLDSGFGRPCPSGTPAPCSFRFFQNLCVEVDIAITADAKCTLDQVKCLGVSSGSCPR